MIIYKTTNTANGKIYIGKDKNNNSQYLGSGKLLDLAIKKYGITKFKKEVLEYCTEENINNREKYWIASLNATSRNVGYNIAKGGSGGDTISNHPRRNEIAEAHSKKLKGKDSQRTTKGPLSVETKKKISEAVSGKRNGMYGKKHSIETREKISKKRFEYIKVHGTPIKSDETRKKISEANRGRVCSEETKKKISEANGGERNGFYGKTHSPEVRRRLSEALSGVPKTNEHKQKLREANLGQYRGTQNKSFIANNQEYKSLGDCYRKTGEPTHIIRKKLKTGEYTYVNFNH